MSVDFHIREQWLANRLSVSRSPIRAALLKLVEMGVVRKEPRHGYFLEMDIGSAEVQALTLPESEEEVLYKRISSERFTNLLSEEVSIAQLVRKYDVSRATIIRVLDRMQEDGLIEKSAGHRWVFQPALNDAVSYEESYRFRMLIEPAAILEPGFSLTPRTLNRLKQIQQELIDGAIYEAEMAELFDIDAQFHEAIAEGCNNRFLSQAIRKQTLLRRLSEYENYGERDRLKESCGEHLAILIAIEKGAFEKAADLLKAHIQLSQEVRPNFAKVRVLAFRRLTRN